MALSWQKDRNSSLRKRAIAEEIEDRRRIAAFERKGRTVPSKAELRLVAEKAAQEHKWEPRGEWVITCQCGHVAKVKIAFSEARQKGLPCTKCGLRKRLSEDDLKPPWN